MTALQLASKIDALPFQLKKEAEKYIESLLEKAQIKSTEDIKLKKPVFGCAKGHFKMSDDFDAPLDDFKEYM